MATKNPAGVAEVSTATASTLGKPLIAANKPSVHQQSLQTGDVAAPAPAKETSIPGKHQGIPESRQDENTATAALTHLPQPESTTSEVVQALKEQKERQAEQVAIRNATDEEADKVPVMAKSTTIKDNVVNTRESEATRPVQGELVVSVTMRGDSRILNGVANVARFFSKKKK